MVENIRYLNGVAYGYDERRNSYYPAGDPVFDPYYQPEKPRVRIKGVSFEAPSGLEEAVRAEVELECEPEGVVELGYRWLEAPTAMQGFEVINGADKAEYVPTGKEGKFIKVEVTGLKGAYGKVTSKAKKMPVA